MGSDSVFWEVMGFGVGGCKRGQLGLDLVHMESVCLWRWRYQWTTMYLMNKWLPSFSRYLMICHMCIHYEAWPCWEADADFQVLTTSCEILQTNNLSLSTSYIQFNLYPSYFRQLPHLLCKLTLTRTPSQVTSLSQQTHNTSPYKTNVNWYDYILTKHPVKRPQHATTQTPTLISVPQTRV